jgi:hypothetical protein
MKRSPGPRKTAHLSDSLHQRLHMYALAASAAGVGILALTPPCEARIVYTKINKVIGPNGVYKLDLNHDGKIDFAFKNLTRGYTSSGIDSLLVGVGTSGRGVEGAAGKSYFLASALQRGARIPNSGKFAPVGQMAVQFAGWFGTYSWGNWVNVANRYLGLKFNIHGKTHYGWARLSVTIANYTVTSTLTGYAYETIANKPIVAGQTRESDGDGQARSSLVDPVMTATSATLGELALGSDALPGWRRRN